MKSIAVQASESIRDRRSAIAEQIVALEWTRTPAFAVRFGPVGRAKSVRDAAYHLSYLAAALAGGRPELFHEYLAWCKVMLARRGVEPALLAAQVAVIAEILGAEFDGEARALILEYLHSGIAAMNRAPDDLPEFITADSELAPLAREYLAALLRGDRQGASRLILDAVEGGMSVRRIYLEVFQMTQREVGRLWQVNRITVAQEHYCSAATQLVMSQLYPHIFATEKTGGSMVATCVSNELHEIGVRMIADFFEMAGWTSYYCGANMPPAAVVATVIERDVTLLAISATMSFHIWDVQALIDAVRVADPERRVKILVGGYAFHAAPELWQTVGADGLATDAEQAVAIGNRWLAEAA